MNSPNRKNREECSELLLFTFVATLFSSRTCYHKFRGYSFLTTYYQTVVPTVSNNSSSYKILNMGYAILLPIYPLTLRDFFIWFGISKFMQVTVIFSDISVIILKNLKINEFSNWPYFCILQVNTPLLYSTAAKTFLFPKYTLIKKKSLISLSFDFINNCNYITLS